MNVKSNKNRSGFKDLDIHIENLRELLETKEGNNRLVKFVIYESALQGKIDQIVNNIQIEKGPSKPLTLSDDIKPDTLEHARKGSKKEGFGSKLFSKANNLITKFIPGL